MKNLLPQALICVLFCCHATAQVAGTTTISKWAGDKRGAVSITFDDGSINQFKQALPLLNRLQLKATFFIITGQIPGSLDLGKFIGRPVKEMSAETGEIPTNEANFY